VSAVDRVVDTKLRMVQKETNYNQLLIIVELREVKEVIKTFPLNRDRNLYVKRTVLAELNRTLPNY
jgi:hypothetical protein